MSAELDVFVRRAETPAERESRAGDTTYVVARIGRFAHILAVGRLTEAKAMARVVSTEVMVRPLRGAEEN